MLHRVFHPAEHVGSSAGYQGPEQMMISRGPVTKPSQGLQSQNLREQLE